MEERQRRLRDYLISHKDEWKNRREILNDLYGGSDNDNLYYSAKAHLLTKDISKLNNSEEIDFIILSNSLKGVKIANSEEVEQRLLSEKKAVLRKLKRVWNKFDKAHKNGQMRYCNDYCNLEIINSYVDEE